MFSLSPGTPGLSAQMPRSTMSILTPAWLARYSASMVFSSTIALTLILIHASLPARAASSSRRMRWIRPVRMVRGATSRRWKLDFGA